MNIQMPDKHEKDAAIASILERGLCRPKPLLRHLQEIYRNLGFEYIFWDSTNSIVVSIGLTFWFTFLCIMSQRLYVFSLQFALSPILYLILTLVSQTKEHISGLYELKMTLKFTIEQIVAFRMICFSGIGIIFCVFTSAIAWYIGEGDHFIHILTVSLFALFLSSFMTLIGIRYMKGKWMFRILPLLWVIIYILPAILLGYQWELLLSKIPAGIHICMTLLLGFFYINEIKKRISTRKGEVIGHVNC